MAILSQLTTAAQQWQSGVLYGALTDAFEWRFFRILKLGDEKGWRIEAAEPLHLTEGDYCFGATPKSYGTVTMLFQALFPNQTFSVTDLKAFSTAADQQCMSWAKEFSGRAAVTNQQENESLRAELEQKEAEFGKREAELEAENSALREQLASKTS